MMFFSNPFWRRFGCIFGGPEPQKVGFRVRGVLIVTKSAFSKNHQKQHHFGFILEGPNHQKSMKNRVRNYHFFLHRFFCVSWRLIVILARFWEAPGVPKINKKLKKSRSGRFRDFKSILGAILKRFWIDFGWISEGFGKNLGKMLGAFWKDKGA